MTKPLVQELLSRVKAYFRSGGELHSAWASSLKCDYFEINFAQASVKRFGKKVELTSTEFETVKRTGETPK